MDKNVCEHLIFRPFDVTEKKTSKYQIIHFDEPS